MRGVFNRTSPTQQAITDVYDERTRFFLVRYPPALVVGLGLTGILAFALTAFAGYRDAGEPTITGVIFHHPWPIYLWFCALIITLQVSIMRHPSLRRQLYETLIVTIIAMIFEGFFALDPELANYLFNVLLHIPIPDIGRSAWTYTIINFGLIAIFWIDTIRRWIRVQFKRPTTRVVDLGIGVTIEVGESGNLPSLPELVSGDLLAGGALTLILFLIFRPDLLTFLSNALQYHTTIDTCTVSWPIGNCTPPGGTLTDPPTLSFMDLIQTLVYVVLGLLTLALTATATAVGALTERVSGVGQNGATPTPGTVTPPIAAGSLSTSGDAGARGAGETVAVVVLNALRAAISRRISIAIDNFLVSLRNVIWPVLIFLGTIAIGTACINIQRYLHLQSDKITCAQNPPYPDATDCAAAISQLNALVNYQDVVLAAILGLACTLCIVLAAALLILSWRVVENSFRFLGLVGFIVLLTFWIFSLALTAFNSLLILLHATPRQPFPLFGASTLASIIAFLLTAIWLVVRQLRQPAGARARAVPAASKSPTTTTTTTTTTPAAPTPTASTGANMPSATSTTSTTTGTTTSSHSPQTMPATMRNAEDDTAPLP